MPTRLRCRLPVALAGLLSLVVCGAWSPQSTKVQKERQTKHAQMTLTQAIRTVSPSIVQIMIVLDYPPSTAEQTTPQPPAMPTISNMGTGFSVSGDGHFVTALHVVRALDDQTFPPGPQGQPVRKRIAIGIGTPSEPNLRGEFTMFVCDL